MSLTEIYLFVKTRIHVYIGENSENFLTRFIVFSCSPPPRRTGVGGGGGGGNRSGCCGLTTAIDGTACAGHC